MGKGDEAGEAEGAEEFGALAVELARAALAREQQSVIKNILMQMMICATENGMPQRHEMRKLLETKPRTVARGLKKGRADGLTPDGQALDAKDMPLR